MTYDLQSRKLAFVNMLAVKGLEYKEKILTHKGDYLQTRETIIINKQKVSST